MSEECGTCEYNRQCFIKKNVGIFECEKEIIEEKNKEIDRLKDLCNKYEEEHKTAFKLWTQKIEEIPDYEERIKLKKEVDRLNNIIETQKKELEEWKKKYGSQ